MNWKQVTIQTHEGVQLASAPEIISASRSTDIPAFHSEWFFKRLDEGYCEWVNPFNRQTLYVSFQNVRAVVFWSKNPAPIMPYLERLDARRISYYFQYTLNDYERFHKGGLEKRVPPLSERIETFRTLSRKLGRERVIWRFDPLLLTDEITVERLLDAIRRVGDCVADCTEKLVFSFADIASYAKVKSKLNHVGIRAIELDLAGMRTVAEGIAEMARGWGIEAATCAEGLDLSDLGIQHNRCIDDELLLRISHDDPALVERFGGRTTKQPDLFTQSETSPIVEAKARKRIKDKGQRLECGCVVSKDIGQYNTCPHFCAYCYANTSDVAVRNNMKKL